MARLTRAGPPAAGIEQLPEGVGSQTLDRGLRALAVLAEVPDPLSVAELADILGLHRSITYRMVRTLEHHQLVVRGVDGRYRPGARLTHLAARVEPVLTGRAREQLERLAARTSMTAFLVVPQAGRAVTVLVIEPRSTVAHVSYRPGAQHDLDQGAPGLAILAGRPAEPGEREAVSVARRRGWALSQSEVIAGYRACAAPVVDPGGQCAGAVSVVYVEEVDEEDLGVVVRDAAQTLAAALGPDELSGASDPG